MYLISNNWVIWFVCMCNTSIVYDAIDGGVPHLMLLNDVLMLLRYSMNLFESMITKLSAKISTSKFSYSGHVCVYNMKSKQWKWPWYGAKCLLILFFKLLNDLRIVVLVFVMTSLTSPKHRFNWYVPDWSIQQFLIKWNKMIKFVLKSKSRWIFQWIIFVLKCSHMSHCTWQQTVNSEQTLWMPSAQFLFRAINAFKMEHLFSFFFLVFVELNTPNIDHKFR